MLHKTVLNYIYMALLYSSSPVVLLLFYAKKSIGIADELLNSFALSGTQVLNFRFSVISECLIYRGFAENNWMKEINEKYKVLFECLGIYSG